jgi:DNA-binding response OmpR family regulator
MGIRLSPLKARIFDLIKDRPGISKKELCEIVYGTVSEARILTIGAHVAQLRDKFEATDLTIRAVQYSGYSITGGRGLMARYRVAKRKVNVV